MTISILGIDIVKNNFQLHGADYTGKAVLRKRALGNSQFKQQSVTQTARDSASPIGTC